MKIAYFAGGCFWCITPTFKETEGVVDVTSGYCGGDEINPTYNEVKSQKTGHRETIKLITIAKKFLLQNFLKFSLVGWILSIPKASLSIKVFPTLLQFIIMI